MFLQQKHKIQLILLLQMHQITKKMQLILQKNQLKQLVHLLQIPLKNNSKKRLAKANLFLFIHLSAHKNYDYPSQKSAQCILLVPLSE